MDSWSWALPCNCRTCSFLRFIPRLFPGLEAAFQVVKLREVELTHLAARLRAAHSASTVHEIGLALVEPGHLLGKVRRVPVKVDRAGDMTRLEFLFRAHIEHDVFPVC